MHTLTGEPDEPDRPATTRGWPYWRHQTWRPAPYRDTTGALADLTRRLASTLLRLRWRLSLDVTVHTFVHAADELTASLTVSDALRHPDTVIALSRAEPDAVPPWRVLGTAEHVDVLLPTDAADTGDGVWKCSTLLLLSFIVDVADAGWPDDDFVPVRSQPRLLSTEANGDLLIRRRPTRARPGRPSRTPPRDSG